VLNIVSVFLHRRRIPLAHRPSRIPLYPIPPLLYLGAALALLVELVRGAPGRAVAALGVLALSLPVYLLWESRHRMRGGGTNTTQ